MDRLEPVMFNDAWGSHISIASLQGRDIPSPLRESELWMGAHESGPAGVERGGARTLLEVIEADPQGELGAACVERFGPRLPFLLKILAPGRAISIQAHPTEADVRRVRDELGPTAASSVYVDGWAKPELLVAVAPFEVFVGLRRHAETVELSARLGVPRLTVLVESATGRAVPEQSLLEEVLAVPRSRHANFAREVVRSCIAVGGTNDEIGRACAAVVRVAEDHPGDIGLVVLLLMNHRVLRPGEYVDVSPGVLHSYVSGLGVEVLGNSDNVVRAGLTSKPVNIPELLRIVDATGDGRPRTPVLGEDGIESFPTASGYFRLHRIRRPVRTVVPGDGGPRILFCLGGAATVRRGRTALEVGPTGSVFLPVGDTEVTVEGGEEIYVVSAALDPLDRP